MEDRTILELLRMEVCKQFGSVGPFIFKKELTNLGIKEDMFTKLDAAILVKRTTELLTALFGVEKALQIEERLLEIVSGECMEPIFRDPFRRDPNTKSPPIPSKKFELRYFVDTLKNAGGGTEE